VGTVTGHGIQAVASCPVPAAWPIYQKRRLAKQNLLAHTHTAATALQPY